MLTLLACANIGGDDVAFRAFKVFELLSGIKDRPAVAVTRFNGSAGQRARQGPGEKKAQIVI